MENDVNEIGYLKTWMYRVQGEWFALIVSILLILGVGYIFSTIDWILFLLIIIGAIIYVRLNQVQYIGNAIRVHHKQFPELYDTFTKYAKGLGISKAALYIKQDPYLQAYTLGLTSCTLVLTSGLVEQLNEKELNFVVGHELGHYAAGHTKISTIVIPVGSNNIISSLIFGFWNRKCELTSDRCGLALTRDVDNTISALIKLAIGKKLYEKLDLGGYVAQIKASDTTMVKLSELLGSHPLITNRIRLLLVYWRENFATINVAQK